MCLVKCSSLVNALSHFRQLNTLELPLGVLDPKLLMAEIWGFFWRGTVKFI